MDKTKECNHFWEVVLPITDILNQKFECKNCGKIKILAIPILDTDELKDIR
jgi:hypothetical protein